MWGTAEESFERGNIQKFRLVPQTCKTILYDSSLQNQPAHSGSSQPVCDRQPMPKWNINPSLARSLCAFKMLLRISSLKIHHETQINLFWQQTLLLSEAHVLSGDCMKISSWYPALFISVKMDHCVLGGGFSRTNNPSFLLCLNATLTLETCCTHSIP